MNNDSTTDRAQIIHPISAPNHASLDILQEAQKLAYKVGSVYIVVAIGSQFLPQNFTEQSNEKLQIEGYYNSNHFCVIACSSIKGQLYSAKKLEGRGLFYGKPDEIYTITYGNNLLTDYFTLTSNKEK